MINNDYNMTKLTLVNPDQLDSIVSKHATPPAPRPRTQGTKLAPKKASRPANKLKSPFGRKTDIGKVKNKVKNHSNDGAENASENFNANVSESTKRSFCAGVVPSVEFSAFKSHDIGLANKRAKYVADDSTHSTFEESSLSTSQHSFSRQSDATGTSGEHDSTDADSEICTYTNSAKFCLPHFPTDRQIQGRGSAITDNTLTPDFDMIDPSIVQKARETFARFIAERSLADVSSDQAISRCQSAPTVPSSGLDTMSSLGLYLDKINDEESNDGEYGQFCDLNSDDGNDHNAHFPQIKVDHADEYDSDDEEVCHYNFGHTGIFRR